MQIIYPHKCLRKIWNAPICEIDSLSTQAQKKYRALKLWAKLLSDGLSVGQACAAVVSAHEVSQKSLYRWRSMYDQKGARGLECQSRKPHRVRQKEWDERVLNRICTIRNHEDTCRMGAAKLYHQFIRDGRDTPSIATIGRMLRVLKETKRIIVPPRVRAKKKPRTRLHAQRYKRSKHAHLVRIQIDVDEYTQQGFKWFVFTAIHTKSRYAFSRSYTRATALCAKDFLTRILDTIPQGMTFDAIQIDGGGEFMAEFEQEMKDRNIPLIVNHPKTPKQNAFVERVHRTIDEELFQVRDIPHLNVTQINENLDDYIDFYNNHRLHKSLGYITPCECIESHATITTSQEAFDSS